MKYDPKYKGMVIHFDDKHMSIFDGETLARKMGVKIVPFGLERDKSGLSR